MRQTSSKQGSKGSRRRALAEASVVPIEEARKVRLLGEVAADDAAPAAEEEEAPEIRVRRLHRRNELPRALQRVLRDVAPALRGIDGDENEAGHARDHDQ